MVPKTVPESQFNSVDDWVTVVHLCPGLVRLLIQTLPVRLTFYLIYSTYLDKIVTE